MAVPCRILLVDDEEDACLVLGDVLEDMGCEVKAVCRPEEAVQIGRAQSFDLVLLDIRMPGMDGIEVLRRIRNGGHREIVMLTGFIDEALDVEARGEGAVDVLHKPVDLQALLQRVMALRSESL
jgi:CheY-like chemotaxis protein